MAEPVVKRMDISFQSRNWYDAKLPFLNGDQFARTASAPLEGLLGNGLPNGLVVAAHQDDEIIGMGGTIKVLADGLKERDSWITYLEGMEQQFREAGFSVVVDDPKGLAVYSRKELARAQDYLAKGNLSLHIPRGLANVWVVYVTDGSKDDSTVMSDFKGANPGLTEEQILEHYGNLLSNRSMSLEEITAALNRARYLESLVALDQVGASGAIFLNYPSSQIKGRNATAVDDLCHLIEFLRPERVYTLSPFEIKHDTHIWAGEITIEAVRKSQVKPTPKVRGYAVWNLVIASEPAMHLEIVDTTEAYPAKTDALHIHSMLGSQGTFGFKRVYEDVRDMDAVNGALLRSVFGNLGFWNAQFRRPRMPSAMLSAEVFVRLDDLAKNPGGTYYDFVKGYFKEFLKIYPVQI